MIHQDGDTLWRVKPLSQLSSNFLVTLSSFEFFSAFFSVFKQTKEAILRRQFLCIGGSFHKDRTAARDRRFRCDWWQTCQLVVAPPKQSQTWSWPLRKKKKKQKRTQTCIKQDISFCMLLNEHRNMPLH